MAHVSPVAARLCNLRSRRLRVQKGMTDHEAKLFICRVFCSRRYDTLGGAGMKVARMRCLVAKLTLRHQQRAMTFVLDELAKLRQAGWKAVLGYRQEFDETKHKLAMTRIGGTSQSQITKKLNGLFAAHTHVMAQSGTVAIHLVPPANEPELLAVGRKSLSMIQSWICKPQALGGLSAPFLLGALEHNMLINFRPGPWTDKVLAASDVVVPQTGMDRASANLVVGRDLRLRAVETDQKVLPDEDPCELHNIVRTKTASKDITRTISKKPFCASVRYLFEQV